MTNQKPCRADLINWINHVSFAVDDVKLFLDTRMNDHRKREVETITDLLEGNIYYITCIDDQTKLYPKYTQYKDIYHCVYDFDLYSKKKKR